MFDTSFPAFLCFETSHHFKHGFYFILYVPWCFCNTEMKEGDLMLVLNTVNTMHSILHIIFTLQIQNLSLCKAPSFEILAGAEWDEGLFWRWRLRQGLFVICARQAIHPSSSQPKKGWSQKLAVSAQQQSRRAVKAERNWLISNAH